MQTRRLAVVTTLVVVVVAVAACHSASGLKSAPSACFSASALMPAQSSTAGHFDSLAIEACAAGEFDRYRLLTYPIAFLAESGVPATVSLKVDGALQSYQAGVLELVGQTAGPNPVPADSIFVEFAWTGDNVTQLVYLQILVPDTVTDLEDLVGKVAYASIDSFTAVTSGSAGVNGQCSTVALPLVDAAAEDLLSGSTCTSGNMPAGFSMVFTPTAGLPDSSFVLPSQSLPGVRIVLAQSTAGQDRIRALKTGRAQMVLR